MNIPESKHRVALRLSGMAQRTIRELLTHEHITVHTSDLEQIGQSVFELTLKGDRDEAALFYPEQVVTAGPCGCFAKVGVGPE